MVQVIQFPVQREIPPYSGELRPLLGIPAAELMEMVFESNFDFLGLEDHDVADQVEFFIDDEYPAKVLVDVGQIDHCPELRGLYYVNLDNYQLMKLSNKPLKHFNSQ